MIFFILLKLLLFGVVLDWSRTMSEVSQVSHSSKSQLGSKGNMDIYDSSIFPRARTGGEINLLPGLERWKKESSLKALDSPLIAKEMQRKSGRNATSREEEDPFPTFLRSEKSD